MRIAVLAHNLIGGGGMSVGRNIVALLPRLGRQHDYLIFVPDGLEYDPHRQQPNVKVRPVQRMNPGARLLFELHGLSKEVAQFKPDVCLALGNIGLLWPTCKQAILIHQPQLLYPPKYYGKSPLKERLRFIAIKRWVGHSLRRTQRVFCQTPVTQQRFAEAFGYPLDQIKIAPNAVSEFTKVDRSQIATPAALRDHGQFNLFLLTVYYTHKNVECLVSLFRQYPEQLKDVRCLITIAAQQHKHAASLLREIARHGLEHKIVNVGPLKQEELAGYFTHCDALFFPTLLESFSGTYLEAMHFGLPILTSDLDFAHYICGDAALYFDPWNTREMLDRILQLKSSEQLRVDLVRKGSQRISTFFKSWETIVSDLLAEIEKI